MNRVETTFFSYLLLLVITSRCIPLSEGLTNRASKVLTEIYLFLFKTLKMDFRIFNDLNFFYVTLQTYTSYR